MDKRIGERLERIRQYHRLIVFDGAMALNISLMSEGQTVPKQLGSTHQPGEGLFKVILAEEIDWQPFAAFPASARLGVLVGDPSQPGPYVIRVRVPHDVKLQPHRHPEDRIYTVISGVFYVGLGSEFNPDKLRAYPPGAVIVLPGNTWHFHWAGSGEYVTQVSGVGPLGLEYRCPTDDPRNGVPSGRE